MKEIVIKIKIPEELGEMKEKIEDIVNKEVEEIVERIKILKKARGCLKTKKSWHELEAELYEDVYR